MPTDESIVVFDKTRNRYKPSAITVDELGGSAASLPTEDATDGAVLTYDETAGSWVPQTLPIEASREALMNVEDGDILTYDSASNSWVPRQEGGVVGAWENDQVTTFAGGTPLIVESVGLTLSGNTTPASPQVSITVTEAMLATTTGANAGYSDTLTVVFLGDASGFVGAASGSVNAEMTFLGETVSNNASINPTTLSRFSFTFALRGVKVGDTATFKFRMGTASHSGATIIAYSAVCFPQGLLQAVPAKGGSYLYQSIMTDTLLPNVQFPSHPTTPMISSYRLYDGNVAGPITNNNPESERPRWVGAPPMGVYTTYTLYLPSSRLAAENRVVAAGASWNVAHVRLPNKIQYDRIAIPTAP